MEKHDAHIEELITYCLRGDRFAQKSLFEMYSGKMMSVCRRYSSQKFDAEDILQEGFIKVFTNLSKYSGTGSFEGWIRRIMINTALNKISRKAFSQETAIEDVYIEEVEESTVIAKLSADDILKLIEELPEGYKIVFNLYVIEGYAHKEISDMLDIEEATSRSQLLKARRLLQKKLNTLNYVSV